MVLTDSNFDEQVLKSETPWMVEVYAEWCPHCKSLATVYAEASTLALTTGQLFWAVLTC